MQVEGLPPAFGFTNGVRTVQEAASTPALAEWVKAGYPLGNHTWSHMNLNEHTAEEFEADLMKNEPVLEKAAPGSDWKWLRYPFLAEGGTAEKRAVVRAFLKTHGYRVAAVTMSFGDYAYNAPYARCLAKGDTARVRELEKAYLAAADASIEYDRSMANSLFGHDIPYVLLMHVGAFDARMLPRLIALYKSRKFSFVTLQQAEAHPFYSNDLDMNLPGDIDTLEAAMRARSLPLPPSPRPTLSLDSLCQ
jgi:peptidoglycan/xylan/chitin deacetylase (PgdA/CDA1 family)